MLLSYTRDRKFSEKKSVGNLLEIRAEKSLVCTEIIKNKVLWKSSGVYIPFIHFWCLRPGNNSLGILSLSTFVEGCECKHGRSEKEIEEEDENP